MTIRSSRYRAEPAAVGRTSCGKSHSRGTKTRSPKTSRGSISTRRCNGPRFSARSRRLQRRGNRVFVLVGPFNEHMLTPASRERYQKVKVTITAWAQGQRKVAYLAPEVLPTELYGDASHPLAEGHALLARQLWDDPAFR